MAGRRLAVALLTALAAAAAAQAQGEPAAFGVARLGSLSVVAGVVLSADDVEMRGGWLDARQRCAAKRRLSVTATIDYAPPVGNGLAAHRRAVFTVVNCAEGGPNAGWTLTAKGLGF